MASRRSYDDGCATAHALELIGERWALLVVRELLLGPKRFSDLRASLRGISPNVLSQRLEELVEASIVLRRKMPPPASVWVYDLTEWGREVEAVIQAMGRWAARSPAMPRGRHLSTDSLVLSFRTMFNPRLAAGFKARIELHLGQSCYRAAIADGMMELVAGSLDGPDAVLICQPSALAGVVYGGRKLAEALNSGEIRIEGSKRAVEKFIALFPLPAPAADGRTRSGRAPRL